jgi:3-deoxy-manno-octulosonate cytidylyltransferase (CMP-KDO synthetase)
MRAIGIIPARFGSTRLPGKPLKDLGGKPIIQHVYERASMAESLQSVIVATDDRRIFEVVEGFGGRVKMTASDHPNGTSRAAEASRDEGAEIVVNVQGDEPFVAPQMIDAVVHAMEKDPDVPSATICCWIAEEKHRDPDVVKVVCDKNGYALYFSRSTIPYPRNAEFQAVYEHIGIYGYRSEFLPVFLELDETPLSQTESLEQLKILEHGYRMRVIESRIPYDALSIDTERDLEEARRLLLDSG